MKAIQTVGVIGTDELGCGIVHACVMAGFTVTQVGKDNAALAGAKQDLASRLERDIAAGRLAASDKAATQKRIAWSTQVADFHGDDFVMVANTLAVPALTQLVRETEAALGTYALIAGNADMADVAAVAGALLRPGQWLGLRFTDPTSTSAPVELIGAPQTGEATQRLVAAFVAALGRPLKTA